MTTRSSFIRPFGSAASSLPDAVDRELRAQLWQLRLLVLQLDMALECYRRVTPATSRPSEQTYAVRSSWGSLFHDRGWTKTFAADSAAPAVPSFEHPVLTEEQEVRVCARSESLLDAGRGSEPSDGLPFFDEELGRAPLAMAADSTLVDAELFSSQVLAVEGTDGAIAGYCRLDLQLSTAVGQYSLYGHALEEGDPRLSLEAPANATRGPDQGLGAPSFSRSVAAQAELDLAWHTVTLRISLSSMYVLKSRRGAGAGSALVEAAVTCVEHQLMHLATQLAPFAQASGREFEVRLLVDDRCTSLSGLLIHRKLLRLLGELGASLNEGSPDSQLVADSHTKDSPAPASSRGEALGPRRQLQGQPGQRFDRVWVRTPQETHSRCGSASRTTSSFAVPRPTA